MKCRHFHKMPAFSGNAPISAGILAGISENAGILPSEMPAFFRKCRHFYPH